MEIVLSRYSNFIAGWKDTMFKISYDDFTYTDVSSLKKTIYHLNLLYFGFFNIDDKKTLGFIIPVKNHLKKIIYIISLHNKEDSNSSNDFKLFGDYFNYYKYALMLNSESRLFLMSEQFKLNTKELYLSLTLYTGLNYHKEILNNIGSNMVLLQSIFMAVSKKIDIMKTSTLQSNETNEENSLDTLNDFSETILAKYPGISLVINSYAKLSSHSFQLEGIDRIRELYMALSRVLFELKRTYGERMINPKSKFGNKLDILSRFTFAKGNISNIDDYQQKNSQLKEKYLKSLEINKQLKKRLKEHLVRYPHNIHFCIKCGNLLKKTDSCLATCLYDDNCLKNSILYCKKCSIGFCNYCIPYLKSLTCDNDHMLKPQKNYYNTHNQTFYCSICDLNIQNNTLSYMCEECKFIICPYCYDDKRINIKPPTCSCGRSLHWRRAHNTQCRKCHKTIDCFWYCFFCRLSYCLNCHKTNKNICSGGHEMKEINVNTFTKENLDKKQNVLIDKLLNIKLKRFIDGIDFQFKTNCSVCDKKFCFKFYYCYRCSLVKCVDCCKS